VPHGGSKNDTIVVCNRSVNQKISGDFGDKEVKI